MRCLLNTPVLTSCGDRRFDGPLPLGAAALATAGQEFGLLTRLR